MNNDNRKALPCNQGFQLRITNDGSCFVVSIDQEVGRGGTCITYRGRALNETIKNKAVIIKEFYPKELEDQIDRDNNMQLKFHDETIKDSFGELLNIFRNGQAQHIIFANVEPGCSLPSTFFIGKSLGTLYAIYDYSEGEVLSEINIEKYTIADALRLAASICDAIQPIHKQYKVYQDIKPSNLFVNELLVDNSDGQQIIPKVYLFDFDTVHPIDDIKYCSYSEGWCAPEQIPNKKGIIYRRKIGIHTDVYSIGVILFWLLTSNKYSKAPTKNHLEAVQEGFDWKGQILRKDPKDALSNNTFIEKLDRLLKMMLIESSEERRNHYPNIKSLVSVKDELVSLIDLAETASIRKGQEIINSQIESSKYQTIDALHQAKDEIIDVIRTSGMSANRVLSDTTKLFGVPLYNDWFTGRKNEIKALETNFSNGEHIQIIYGMGGMGKTQLAIKYLYDNIGSYSMIHWINGDSIENIVKDYRLFLQSIQSLPADTSFESICNSYVDYMDSHRDWLIVYDNCDYYLESDYNAFKRYCLPKRISTGNILITSRNNRRIGRSTIVNVHTMAIDEATQFLLQRTEETGDGLLAEKLAARLGCFPLAMEIAGAYISATPSCNITKYLGYLQTNIEILDNLEEVTDYNNTVKEVLLLTLDRIKVTYSDTKVATFIKLFLYISSFSDPQELNHEICTLQFLQDNDYSSRNSISIDTLEVLQSQNDWNDIKEYSKFCSSQINRDLINRILLKYGFVMNNGNNLLIHELQQEVIRRQIIPAEEYSIWEEISCVTHNEYFHQYYDNCVTELREKRNSIIQDIVILSDDPLTRIIEFYIGIQKDAFSKYEYITDHSGSLLKQERSFIRFISPFDDFVYYCINDNSNALTPQNLMEVFEYMRMGIELFDKMNRNINNTASIVADVIYVISLTVRRFGFETILRINYSNQIETFRGKAENNTVIACLFRQMYNLLVRNNHIICAFDDSNEGIARIEEVLELLHNYLRIEYFDCNSDCVIEDYLYSEKEQRESERWFYDFLLSKKDDDPIWHSQYPVLKKKFQRIQHEMSSGYKPISEKDDHRIIEDYLVYDLAVLKEVYPKEIWEQIEKDSIME